jgi:hypothetical protein
MSGSIDPTTSSTSSVSKPINVATSNDDAGTNDNTDANELTSLTSLPMSPKIRSMRRGLLWFSLYFGYREYNTKLEAINIIGYCNPFLSVLIVLVATATGLFTFLILADALDSISADIIVVSFIVVMYTISVYFICLVWQDFIQVRFFLLIRKSCHI